MSIALKINPAGDLVLDSRKRMTVISGTEKVLQDIAVILRTLKGSFHLSANFGTDHVAIVSSERNIQVATSEIRKALDTYAALESYTVSCTYDEDRHLVVALSGTLKTGEPISLEETL